MSVTKVKDMVLSDICQNIFILWQLTLCDFFLYCVHFGID